MKTALIADIHGNFHALEAVLDDIGRMCADNILVLGDLVFKGPLPEKCVRTIQGLNTVVLQGNIDELVGKGSIQPGFAKSPEQEEALKREMAWTRSRLSGEELDYLAGLAFSHERTLAPGVELRCVHATPQNVLDIVLPTESAEGLERMFAGSSAAITAYAHIHQPFIRYLGGRAIVNTGSVGLPFDGDPRASYAVIESDGADYSIAIRRVRYDVEAAVRAFDGSGHPFAASVIAAIRSGTRPV